VKQGAAAFVFDDAGRVLVVKENYGRFRWSLPGGRSNVLHHALDDAVARRRDIARTGLPRVT
jgi:ADP-ribose pyrophosphatase YjhB (NUDIX family)